MKRQLTVKEVADRLIRAYRIKFGGGPVTGRFGLTREHMRDVIAQRTHLRSRFIALLTMEMKRRGYVLIDLRDFSTISDFAVVRARFFDKLRRPARVTGKVIRLAAARA